MASSVTRTATSPLLQLGHRPLGLLELSTVPALPERPPDQPSSRLDLGRDVGELEGDRLVLDNGPSKLFALLSVLERELECGTSYAEGLGANDRPGGLERLERHRGPRALSGLVAG